MKLGNKIIFPVILVLVLIIGGIAVANYFATKNTVEEIAESEMSSTVGNLHEQILLADEIDAVIVNTINEKNLALSRALAEIISDSPEMLEYDQMTRLADLLGVDEVHVTDDNGVLLWGNVKDFYGFDFGTTDQTKPFLKILTDKKLEIAQAPEFRGTTGDLFQYTGVSRTDTTGIVQVGINADVITEMTALTSAQNFIVNSKIGEDGYVIIVDNGVISAHPKESFIGQDVSKQKWFNDIVDCKDNTLWVKIDDKDYYALYDDFDGKSIIALYDGAEFYSHVNTSRNITLAIGVLAVIIIAVVIGLISKFFVLDPIKVISQNLGNIAAGNLNMIKMKHTKDEMGQVANDLYKVSETITSLIDDLNNLHTQQMIEGNTDYLIDSHKYKGAYGQVTSSIDELTVGLNEEVNMLVTVLNHFDKGDFDFTIKKMPGKKAAINNNVEAITSKIKSIISKANELVNAAIEGELDKRVDSSQYEGDWAMLLERFNLLFEAVSVPIERTSEALAQLSSGYLDSSITEEFNGEFNKIKDLFNEAQVTFRSYIAEISTVLGEISNQNLDVSIDRRYRGDFNDIKDSIDSMIEVFNRLLQDISKSSDEIASSTVSLNHSAESLALGANQQTESITSLTEVINQVESITIKNSNAASSTNDFLLSTRANAEKSNTEMEKMLQAINAINESSDDIQKIIGVIDEIALQTNLLALNAAVEAARAGENGKGFGVVAEQVRVLAGRSQSAARETAALIEQSAARAQDGVHVANQTAELLSEIVDQIINASDSLAAIAKDSSTQTNLINQVTTNVESISNVTMQNSSAAEETAAAAQELSAYVEMFRSIVSKFKLK